MVKVIFYGNLKEEFGESKNFSVNCFRDIFKALEVNTKRFRKFMMKQDRKGFFYRIFINDAPISSAMEMNYKFGKGDYVVKIIPVPMGKSGFLGGKGVSALSIGLGAIFIAGGALLLASGGGGIIGVGLIFTGISLLAAGVIGLLSPQPKFQPDQSKKQSYLFDGILETAREGLPVPVVYGRLLVQGITINSEINTVDTDGSGVGYNNCIDTNATADLAGLLWTLPNLGHVGSSYLEGCYCPPSSISSIVMAGDAGKTYDVTMRVRGIVELNIYLGGTTSGYFQTGGTASTINANIYQLDVSNPPSTYYINAGDEHGGSDVYLLDYEITIPIASNATLTLTALSVDNIEALNHTNLSTPNDDPTRPIKVNQPYDGQFGQLDVLSIVPV